MGTLRIGLIGYGNMGSEHARYIAAGEVPNAALTAVCDIAPEKLKAAREALGEHVNLFDDAGKLFASGTADAVIIATPHYFHPPLAIAALGRGLHVLIEKPAGVYTKQVLEMNAVAGKSDKVFGIMFNQRNRPIYQKLREIVQSGELGEIKRTNWIITDWYRTQAYYNSSAWRATWGGEGGGVLMNQAPHQLDLWQWICGMPKRVRAICSTGRYHDIEVEDDVTACVEYKNGATGVFITSTGEAPGSNRFEIMADNGKVVMEDNKITFWRNRVSERQFNRQSGDPYKLPECWKCDIPFHGNGEEHKGITKNWVRAILKGEALFAPGQEGLECVKLINAMFLSAWTGDWVEFPLDDELYHQKLMERAGASRHVKKTTAAVSSPDSFGGSFHK